MYTDIQKVFMLSKVNGAALADSDLPVQNWTWPKGTWFQKRLARKCECGHAGTFQVTDGWLCDSCYRMQVEASEQHADLGQR